MPLPLKLQFTWSQNCSKSQKSLTNHCTAQSCHYRNRSPPHSHINEPLGWNVVEWTCARTLCTSARVYESKIRRGKIIEYQLLRWWLMSNSIWQWRIALVPFGILSYWIFLTIPLFVFSLDEWYDFLDPQRWKASERLVRAISIPYADGMCHQSSSLLKRVF